MLRSLLKKFGHRHFILSGIRKRIIWFFFDAHLLKDFEFTESFFGLKYSGNTHIYIDRFKYFFGAYELGMLAVIRDVLGDKKDKVFVDVGANIGHHSLFASIYAREVHSFEPYHKVLSTFKDRIQENGVRNIFIHSVGLGSKNSVMPFFEPNDVNTGTGSFISNHSSSNLNKGQELEIRVGDEILSALDRIDLIKIDVEGFEVEVLKGLLDTLKKFRPTLLIEYSVQTMEAMQSTPEIKRFLQDNYQIKRFRNPNDFPPQLQDADFETAGFVDLMFCPK